MAKSPPHHHPLCQAFEVCKILCCPPNSIIQDIIHCIKSWHHYCKIKILCNTCYFTLHVLLHSKNYYYYYYCLFILILQTQYSNINNNNTQYSTVILHSTECHICMQSITSACRVSHLHAEYHICVQSITSACRVSHLHAECHTCLKKRKLNVCHIHFFGDFICKSKLLAGYSLRNFIM